MQDQRYPKFIYCGKAINPFIKQALMDNNNGKRECGRIPWAQVHNILSACEPRSGLKCTSAGDDSHMRILLY